jgi:excisionase family DNA binding protein
MLDVVENAPRGWPPLSRRGYYSTAETAAVLGQSSPTASRLALEGNLPATRTTPRGPWRFDRQKIDAIAAHGIQAVMGAPLPSRYQDKRRNGGPE